jgi:RNA polymerase sigma-70 factor (ECF subfamily)
MPPEANERTSSTLLERARRQDPLAWGRLVDLYTPLVWRWCRRLNVKPEDTEDVCQEVMRAVHRALPAFRRDRPGDSFRAWLRTITRRKVVDQWHRRSPADGEGGSDAVSRLQGVPDPEADVTPHGDDDLELGILYRRAVRVIRGECEDRTWTAFWRVTIDDEPVEAVAAALQMSPNAVYLARSRIRKRLRELLVELGEDSPADN